MAFWHWNDTRKKGKGKGEKGYTRGTWHAEVEYMQSTMRLLIYINNMHDYLRF
jgi:hypothetical protein